MKRYRPSVTVIGTGALGTVLAKGLHQSGYPVFSLFNRHLRKAEALSKEVGAKFVSEFPEGQNELGSLVFLTVQDSEIAPVAQQLARLALDFRNYLFVHCSGNESAEVLGILKRKGADVAAFHPLQTFTAKSTPGDFRNIYFDVEANKAVSERLRLLALSLGGHTIDVPAEGKPYLHAAAVLASNYLVTLLDASGKIAALGGIGEEEALEAMLPLIYKTIENVEKENPRSALSGPIKRADAETVQKHIELLKKHTDLLTLYKKLGLHTLKMTSGSPGTAGEKYKRLYKLLEDGQHNE